MVRVGTIKTTAIAGKVSTRRALKNRVPKLRGSLTPGTVVIPLTGQFRGKHVVMLKQLSSGLLLVSGPFKINGVPLRRVNARYVIATSTKVDVSSVDVSKVNDDYFKRAKSSKEDFLAKKEREPASDVRKAAQKEVDAKITAKLSPIMKKYLASKFALSNSQNAHELKF